MSAVDASGAWQLPQLGEGRPHLLRGALEEATASHGEKCVPAEQDLSPGKVVAHMAAGVPRGLVDPHLLTPEGPGVSIRKLDIDPRDTILVARRAHNLDIGPSLLLELHVPPDVVPVVVSVDDIVECEPLLLELRQHGRGVGGVNACGHPALGLVDEENVVVVENRDHIHRDALGGEVGGKAHGRCCGEERGAGGGRGGGGEDATEVGDAAECLASPGKCDPGRVRGGGRCTASEG
mmetsp:Transcript_38384/g.121262  ORF Transcript_38384/g.121262 Transcript_38384/m.121262 type:complete len:236 (+) Transcript_38384:358-1065(+)